MAIQYIDCFINSVNNIMPQFGFGSIRTGATEIRGREIENDGVIIVLGIMGDLKGNVIYTTSRECAFQIASNMMMGMPVTEFDEMAQSAVSELGNMLTANATIELAGQGVTVDISTPTLMHGKFTATAATKNVTHVEMFLDDMPFDINISFE